MVYVGETMEKAREDFRDAVIWYYRTIAKYVAPKQGEEPIESYAMFRDLAATLSWETLLERDAVICGEPDYAVEKLHGFQQSYGFTEVLCWTRLDHRKVLNSMELMCNKVIPHLRDSQPPPPPTA